MSPADSRLRVRDQDGVTVVEFVDRNILDEANIAQITDEMMGLVAGRPNPRLLISFANVEHLSSAALGALIKINMTVKENDGQLRLANINDQIFEVFQITRLDQLFQVHPSTSEALGSFR